MCVCVCVYVSLCVYIWVCPYSTIEDQKKVLGPLEMQLQETQSCPV